MEFSQINNLIPSQEEYFGNPSDPTLLKKLAKRIHTLDCLKKKASIKSATETTKILLKSTESFENNVQLLMTTFAVTSGVQTETIKDISKSFRRNLSEMIRKITEENQKKRKRGNKDNKELDIYEKRNQFRIKNNIQFNNESERGNSKRKDAAQGTKVKLYRKTNKSNSQQGTNSYHSYHSSQDSTQNKVSKQLSQSNLKDNLNNQKQMDVGKERIPSRKKSTRRKSNNLKNLKRKPDKLEKTYYNQYLSHQPENNPNSNQVKQYSADKRIYKSPYRLKKQKSKFNKKYQKKDKNSQYSVNRDGTSLSDQSVSREVNPMEKKKGSKRSKYLEKSNKRKIKRVKSKERSSEALQNFLKKTKNFISQNSKSSFKKRKKKSKTYESKIETSLYPEKKQPKNGSITKFKKKEVGRKKTNQEMVANQSKSYDVLYSEDVKYSTGKYDPEVYQEYSLTHEYDYHSTHNPQFINLCLKSNKKNIMENHYDPTNSETSINPKKKQSVNNKIRKFSQKGIKMKKNKKIYTPKIYTSNSKKGTPKLGGHSKPSHKINPGNFELKETRSQSKPIITSLQNAFTEISSETLSPGNVQKIYTDFSQPQTVDKHLKNPKLKIHNSKNIPRSKKTKSKTKSKARRSNKNSVSKRNSNTQLNSTTSFYNSSSNFPSKLKNSTSASRNIKFIPNKEKTHQVGKKLNKKIFSKKKMQFNPLPNQLPNSKLKRLNYPVHFKSLIYKNPTKESLMQMSSENLQPKMRLSSRLNSNKAGDDKFKKIFMVKSKSRMKKKKIPNESKKTKGKFLINIKPRINYKKIIADANNSRSNNSRSNNLESTQNTAKIQKSNNKLNKYSVIRSTPNTDYTAYNDFNNTKNSHAHSNAKTQLKYSVTSNNNLSLKKQPIYQTDIFSQNKKNKKLTQEDSPIGFKIKNELGGGTTKYQQFGKFRVGKKQIKKSSVSRREYLGSFE